MRSLGGLFLLHASLPEVAYLHAVTLHRHSPPHSPPRLTFTPYARYYALHATPAACMPLRSPPARARLTPPVTTDARERATMPVGMVASA